MKIESIEDYTSPWAQFAQANSQAHLVITANEIASSRIDDLRTQPTYAAVDSLATPAGKADTIPADNTKFVRITKIARVGGPAATDSVDFKSITVFVTHPSMKRTISKTSAIAAF